MTRLLQTLALLAGLAVVGWIGAGHLGNPLALGVTLLIGAFYLVGAFELLNFQRATDSLTRALAQLGEAPATLAGWLDTLDPSLRHPVRLRIEGERSALPGPVLAPYLAGLLVLLGMVGTFLGMVVTLNGTGTALQGAGDLSSIRDALAAPVRGLGLAFGTSVAGVAASAMLGLASALCRRQRLLAGQSLDGRIASVLRPFSLSHQREASLRLQQQQAEAMPALLGQLAAMVSAMEQQQQALSERLAAGQQRFHDGAQAAYTQLAESVGQSLQRSLDDSARVASATIAPMAETTMAAIAREAAALHDKVAGSVAQQLETLAQGFAASAAQATQGWQGAVAEQQRANEAQALGLRASLADFSTHFTQRADQLVGQVAERLDQTVAGVARQWQAALAQQQEGNAQLEAGTRQALDASATRFGEQTAALLAEVAQAHQHMQAALSAGDTQRLAAWTGALDTLAASLQQAWQQAGAAQDAQQQQLRDELAHSVREMTAQSAAHADRTLGQIGQLLDAAAQAPRAAAQTLTEVAAHWSAALAQQQDTMARLEAGTRQALDESAARFGQQTATLLDNVAQAHQQLQGALGTGDAQRLAAWSGALDAVAASLQQGWQEAGALQARQQQALRDELARSVRDMTEHSATHASRTVEEIGRLLQAAAQAPQAAAETLAELREKLTDSMARDNAMLEERTRLLATLGTLLDAVNHASTEQRSAVDAMVAGSADMLERIGGRFAQQVEVQTERLGEVAAQVTGSAVDMASLGDAFGHAVQLFSQSNDNLAAHLQRIEGALDKSMARSDEQLAYYVAQAREVIDLSLMSQKRIVDDLQQLAAHQANAGAAA